MYIAKSFAPEGGVAIYTLDVIGIDERPIPVLQLMTNEFCWALESQSAFFARLRTGLITTEVINSCTVVIVKIQLSLVKEEL
jgi:hypothetical protein